MIKFKLTKVRYLIDKTLLIMENKVTEIFFYVDEFCNEFNKTITKYQLSNKTSKNKRNKPCRMHDSEVITIMILFHLSSYRNIKKLAVV